MVHVYYLRLLRWPKVKLLMFQTLQENKDLWIASGPPPQHFIVDITNLSNAPQYFNIFGFDCWHDYNTNPSTIQISYTLDGKKYICCAKLDCEYIAGWQHFKISEIPCSKAKYIKILILNNYGGEKTYINQIFFTSEPIKDTEDQFQKLLVPKKRQKTNSQYLKLTSTEKQLKRVTQRVKNLQQQNQKCKNHINEQAATIVKMENTIKMLFQNMEKLEGIVEKVQKNMLPPKDNNHIIERKLDFKQSHSIDPKQKNIVSNNKKYSRKVSQTSSQMSIYDQNQKLDDQPELKKKKIQNLLQSLQEKLKLKIKMQKKLKSPRRHDSSGGQYQQQ